MSAKSNQERSYECETCGKNREGSPYTTDGLGRPYCCRGCYDAR